MSKCNFCESESYGNGLCRKHYDADYYQRNKLKRKAQMLEYEKLNKSARKISRRDNERQRYHNDLQFRFQKKIRRCVQRAFKKLDMIKGGKTFSLLGFKAEELKNKMSSYLDKECESCHNVTVTLDNSAIDHIIPLCSAKSREDIINLNQLSNLRLICRHCNAVKLEEDLRFRDAMKAQV
jgi:5-methylcytosine-specific restriction endonuclease McrA